MSLLLRLPKWWVNVYILYCAVIIVVINLCILTYSKKVLDISIGVRDIFIKNWLWCSIYIVHTYLYRLWMVRTSTMPAAPYALNTASWATSMWSTTMTSPVTTPTLAFQRVTLPWILPWLSVVSGQPALSGRPTSGHPCTLSGPPHTWATPCMHLWPINPLATPAHKHTRVISNSIRRSGSHLTSRVNILLLLYFTVMPPPFCRVVVVKLGLM